MNQPYLYKFGKEEHINNLAYSGKLYLNAASRYGEKAKLSKGAYDSKELIIEQKLPRGSKLESLDRNTGKPKGELVIVDASPLQATAVTDFYIFCMSGKFDQRLFDDFDADTCLVIREPAYFMEAVAKGVSDALPEWGGCFDDVHYYSPEKFYTWDIENVDIFFAKRNQYEYQEEFRFVCVPPEPKEKLEPVTIDIGSLLFRSSMIFKER